MTTSYFAAHPEVAIDPETPIPDWGSSPKGYERIRASCGGSLLDEVDDVVVSDERNALDCAETLHARRGSSVLIHTVGRQITSPGNDLRRSPITV